MKLFLYAEHVLTCYAARKLGRPVKWTSERSEAFLSDTHGRDNITLGEIALDADGKFLALRTRNVANMGAYLSNFAPFIPTMAGTGVLASVYGFQAVYANVIGVFTNTVPVDAYRGAGRPESNYLVERLIDAAARELGIDRVELRRRNMVGAGGDAAHDAGGQDLRQRRFPHGARRRAEDAWTGPASRPAAPRRPSAASGAASAWPITWKRPAARRPSGRKSASPRTGSSMSIVGTQSTGQGHETAYVQLTVDRLGVPGEKVRIRQGDTDTIPDGRRHRRRAQPVFRGPGDPGHRRDRHREGPPRRVRGAGGGAGRHRVRGRPLHHRRHRSRHRHHRHWPRPSAPAPAKRRGRDHARCRRGGARSRRTPSPTAATSPRWRSIPRPGMVQVLRYSVTDDVGKAVNPLIVRGQVHGGVAQGFGQAMLETHRLRSGVGPAAVRQLHGLRAAARRRPAGHRGGADRGAVRHQSARREGRGRGRRGRQPAGGDQRASSMRWRRWA